MRDLRFSEPAIFWWWDDALKEAIARGTLTRQKFAVKAHAGMWRIAPAHVEEACS